MLASVPAGYIRYTLGVASGELTTGTELNIINDACRELENCRGWKWQEAVSRPLSLRIGEPFVRLPSDFREIVAIETNPSLLNNIVLSSWDEILELRTNSIQSWGGYYRAVPRSEFPETKNFLGYTAAFDNAAWTASSVTPTADQAVSPAGESSGVADQLAAGSTSGFVRQAVAAASLKDGQDYMFSVYLKWITPVTESQIVVEQRGAGGGVSSTAAPRTVGTIAWSATGVPTISGTSEGSGLHDVRVQSVGDSWYRLSAAISFDARESVPATDIACYIYPDTAAGSGSIYAWGAQFEEIEIHEDPYPTQYEGNAAAYSNTVSDPVWRLSIWPTPTEDSVGNFAIVYRKKLPTIAAESDTIPLPDFMEPMFNELVRIFARGYHEEDVAHLHARLESLYSSRIYDHAVRQDGTTQDSYGPMRGLAASSGRRYRNWGSWTTIPTPS